MKSLLILSLISALLLFTVWCLLKAVLRNVSRLGVVLCMCLACGLSVWAVFPGTTAGQAQFPVLAAIAMWFGTCLMLIARPRMDPPLIRQPETSREKPSRPTASRPFRANLLALFRRKPESRSFDVALDALAEQAIWAANRVAVARRSCERFRDKLRQKKLDPEAHDSLAFMERRIPEFVHAQLDAANSSSGPDRHAILTDLVDVLERYAADCERRSHEQLGRAEIQRTALRNRIEQYLHAGRALGL